MPPALFEASGLRLEAKTYKAEGLRLKGKTYQGRGFKAEGTNICRPQVCGKGDIRAERAYTIDNTNVKKCNAF